MMKTYWLVNIVCLENGAILACLARSIQAEERPENEKVSTSEIDIYQDWFGSHEVAEAFTEVCRDRNRDSIRKWHEGGGYGE
jgi:3-methyladenine DNA glycosylase Mpg